ncbi:MAG: PPC domain-containing protein [Thermoanaerobaculia bacterium]
MQLKRDRLNSADCTLDDGTYTEFWRFSATAGQRIVASMRSTSVDSYLFLVDPDAKVVAENDNGGGGSNARIDFTLTDTGERRGEVSLTGCVTRGRSP